jgi:hypothetical protein
LLLILAAVAVLQRRELVEVRHGLLRPRGTVMRGWWRRWRLAPVAAHVAAERLLLVEIGPEGWAPTQQSLELTPLLRPF